MRLVAGPTSDRPFGLVFVLDRRELAHSLDGDLLADMTPFRWLDECVMGDAYRMKRALDLPLSIAGEALQCREFRRQVVVLP